MPSAVEVVDRGAEADRLGDRRRARLELPRHLVGGEAVDGDVADHLAAAEERRHRLEQLARGPRARRCRSGRSILWAENATKSASHACTSTARCGTAWHASTSTSAPAACAASASGRMSLIVPSTFDIALTARSLAPSRSAVEVAQVEAVVGGERDPAQLDAALGGEDVPRHDVGVVLHVREHDGVALAQVGARPRVRDEVDRLGRVADEDDLVGAVRVDEAGDLARARPRTRRSPPRRSCTRRGGCWRSTCGSSGPSRRARRGASATTTRSRGRRAACR